MPFLETDRDQGFTLIALLVAMTLSLIIIAAITSAFISQSNAYNAQEQVNEMQQNARAAVDMMTREIKMAGYDPKGAGFSGIPYNASQLGLLADLNSDSDTGDPNEDITYSYDATNLQILRSVGGTATTFAENITGFTFAYLDANGTATTTTNQIRQIQITVTARTRRLDPKYSTNGGYRTYQLMSLITPINLAL